MCSPIEEHHNIFIESFNCIFFVLQIENRAINENIAGTITIMIPAFSILKIAPFFSGCHRIRRYWFLFVGPAVWENYFYRNHFCLVYFSFVFILSDTAFSLFVRKHFLLNNKWNRHSHRLNENKHTPGIATAYGGFRIVRDEWNQCMYALASVNMPSMTHTIFFPFNVHFHLNDKT